MVVGCFRRVGVTTCSVRPCLQWIKNPETRDAIVFLAKFYGRAGLMNLINARPDHLRPCYLPTLYQIFLQCWPYLPCLSFLSLHLPLLSLSTSYPDLLSTVSSLSLSQQNFLLFLANIQQWFRFQAI
ncbi:hypothetical protein AMTRI_Chr09g39780 [Amborella trichopoda]